jgi:hypothetical protein
MAESDIRREFERLDKLSPEARSRVEDTIRKAIEQETVAGGLGGASAAGNIFSRGWIFSRLTPTAMDLGAIRELPGVASLNPQEFTEFASRLADLKKQAGPGS